MVADHQSSRDQGRMIQDAVPDIDEICAISLGITKGRETNAASSASLISLVGV
jgi:hypothetical protein